MVNFFVIIYDVFLRVINLYMGVLAGYLFIKSPLNKYRSQFINITINVLTPFLIFVSLIGISWQDAIIYPVISIVLVTMFGIYFPKFLAWIKEKSPPSPAELCTSTFPNALNFPFPIIYAFAPTGLGLASIFLALSIIARNTVGFWISESKLNRNAIRQILLFPPIWGIVAGIIMRIFLPDVSASIPSLAFVDIIFEIAIFCTLMTVGFGIEKPKMEYFDPIVRTALTRFVLMGIIGFGVIIMFHPAMYIAIPFLVQLMAPPAVYNGLYAEKLGMDTELTTQIIISLTMVALLILPVQLFFIQLII